MRTNIDISRNVECRAVSLKQPSQLISLYIVSSCDLSGNILLFLALSVDDVSVGGGGECAAERASASLARPTSRPGRSVELMAK